MKNILLLMLFGLLLLNCKDNSVKKKGIPSPTMANDTDTKISGELSVINLIANPSKYNGKIIQVIGYVTLDFERHAIFLHKDDYEHGIDKNGIWIDLEDINISRHNKEGGSSKPKLFQKGYYLVVGKFDMNAHGHMSAFSGGIKEITKLDPRF